MNCRYSQPSFMFGKGFKTVWISLFLMACLGLGSLSGCSGTLPVTGFQTESQAVGTVADYLLKVSESFQVKAVEPEHQAQVDSQIALFEADLKSGKVNDYYQNPSFSILLAAGSEGSFFNSKEGIEKIGASGAVFAQVLVFQPNQTPALYKGQFSNGRFYFNGDTQASFDPQNTAYLISLDLNLDTRVFKGQLVAGSEGSFIRPGEGLPAELVAGSEGSFVREPSPAVLAAKIKAYQPILTSHAIQGPAFAEKVGELKFVFPAFPPALGWTETFARLQRAYPDEMRFALDQLDGLPENESAEAWRRMIDKYSARYKADCGSLPPDSGRLYPQRTKGVVPPQGYQSDALDQVIAELPALKAEFEALHNRRPPPWELDSGTEAILKKFLASNPETFAKYHWTDQFAPPDCVKARKGGLHPGEGGSLSPTQTGAGRGGPGGGPGGRPPGPGGPPPGPPPGGRPPGGPPPEGPPPGRPVSSPAG